MNILFCHDGPVNCDEKNRYYAIGFNDKFFQKYAEIFGNISFVTRVDKTKSLKYVESEKLTIEKYPVIEYPNYLTLKGIFARGKRQSTKRLKQLISECDAVITWLPSFLGSKCVKIAQKLKKPVLIEMVGCPWDALFNHGLSGKILAPYMYFKTKRQVKKATDVLYVTYKFLQKRYPTFKHQLGCPVIELRDDSETVTLEKRKQNRNDNKIIIGTLGKIDLKYKGHATVIDAIKRLKEKGLDVQYQIVGPGDKTNLENQARSKGVLDNIVFVGPMGHDKIFDWLDTIDIYIQPSLTEGMPRALIEAMSRGCPCIASNAGGMPELLEEKYIFEKGNVTQLTNILLNARNNGLFEQGLRNKEFTNQFKPNIIKEKRTAFYKEFEKYVKRHLQNG